MSEASVSDALRSSARLVVIEAPAGCGKTFQGAAYAMDTARTVSDGGRILILTHTHAACDVFAKGTAEAVGRVEIRTIDSLIGQIATAYHLALDLPPDTGAWARCRPNGYDELAGKVARLLRASPMIARALAHRYPVVICDEHQDASAHQHALVLACHEAGCAVRVFGDPMQRIYGSRKKTEIEADKQRWEALKRAADVFDALDRPRRWAGSSEPLGRWVLAAHAVLKCGERVDLRGDLPPGVAVLFAENRSAKPRGYSLAKEDVDPIYQFVRTRSALLVLAAHNETADALRALFGRRLPIWEGHVREGLSVLASAVRSHRGDAQKVADATVIFLNYVATGFSRSAYGNELLAEVCSGCIDKRRGKAASLQALGRHIVDEPNHQGVSKLLTHLHDLISADPAFRAVKVDYHREFWDAVRLGAFDDPDEGFAELAHRRSHSRPPLPVKAISTINKAKGLECSNVLIIPCDARHFSNSPAARCRLYVAMSRAMRSLTLVVSRESPSPLIVV